MCVVKLLQMVQNVRGVWFSTKLKWAHVIILLMELHRLPVAGRIKFKHLRWPREYLLDLLPLTWTISLEPTLQLLCSVPNMSIVWQSHLHRHSNFRLLSYLVPQRWNDLPSSASAGATLSFFKQPLKTQIFREHLLSQQHLSFYYLVSLPLPCLYLFSLPLHSCALVVCSCTCTKYFRTLGHKFQLHGGLIVS